MSNKHFVRYGTAAEQKYMKDYQHAFDGVVINGSMLAHVSKSISLFVHKDMKSKSFFVDPMTHSFQHDLSKIKNNEGEIKLSIQKLINIYGNPATILLSKFRALRPDDFSNEKTLSQFVKSVLEFQYKHIQESLSDEYREIVEYLRIDQLGKPDFLISPYFYLSKNNQFKWTQINLQLIEESLKHKTAFNNLPIYAQLVIDRQYLNDTSELDRLIQSYSIADGLLYWIDGFDETEASVDELRAVKRMVRTFKDGNEKKRILSLYGGYFSQLLLKEGLDGVVHGLEYGENRDVVPVGGGIPLSKYYLPAVKKRIPANTMVYFLKINNIRKARHFFDTICDCRVCRKTMQSDNVVEDFNNFIRSRPVLIKYTRTGRERIREIEYPLRESKELCLFHYLEAKSREFMRIHKLSREDLTGELKSAFEKYKKQRSINEYVGHLERWAEAFND
ncbi:MAG: hypothetical protein ACYDHW_12840 [Syntrophorhabdaceae bacterium]